jgi:ATP-dependent exoDNAse (exonuclease V) beta subunit
MKVDGLIDAAARMAIREQLDTTLVVEAAAGTGKTTELVQRITRIVETGKGRVSTLIAVTFTEKAAGEMKLRLRTELDRSLLRQRENDVVRARVQQALSELETARIGTIHALCAELLRAHPVEAGVDPGFRVADGELTQRLLRTELAAWLERVRQAPPPGVLRVLSRARVEEPQLAQEALWRAVQSLADTRDFDALYAFPKFDRETSLRAVAEELRALAELANESQETRCPLRRALQLIGRTLASVEGGSLDELEAALRKLSRERDAWGLSGRGERFGRRLPRAEVVQRREHARALLTALMADVGAELSALLCRELRAVVEAYEARKAREGVLDFFDLLLRTRALLRQSASVRARMADSVSHLCVDEFQDIDPVQCEILLYLAASDPVCNDAYAAPLVPGKLFVVGDPKQSIYRFRRADIALYDRIKRHLVETGAEVLTLSTSFRSLPEIQGFVNATFAPFMSGDVTRGEAAYVPLAAHRPARLDQPSVVALPAPRPFGRSGRVTKTAVEACMPEAVAAFVTWLVRESGYTVHEGGELVPVEARHVCLLFSRFRNFEGDVTRPYVRELEARSVPHLLSGGRSFFAREEVEAMLSALSAIEWPDDKLAVYSTLRGPFVGLTDEQLLQYRLSFGTLSPMHKVELDALAPPLREVAEVLSLLRRLHLMRNRRSIATTLEAFLAGLRAHAGVAIWPTGEQALGNVLRMAELARSFEQKPEATSFRVFLEALALRAEQGEMADAPVVEESSDGVRLMTVHAAKGLEFPVVVLCDPGAPQRVEHPSRYIDAERGLWAQALCGAEPEELRMRRAEVAQHDEAERIRLTYVAATRAKEMLVVPTTCAGPVAGWLQCFEKALHPARAQMRSPRPHTYRLPAFGSAAMQASAQEAPVDLEETVCPGVHQPELGQHQVVFWDPQLFGACTAPVAGISQGELLKAEGAAAPNEARATAAHEAYEARVHRTREAGSTPSYSVRGVTASHSEGDDEEGQQDPQKKLAGYGVTLVDSGAARGGDVGGTRFGSLVHGLFEHLEPGAPEAELAALARALGRSLGASHAECEEARRRVHLAQKHPFFARIAAAHARHALFREAALVHADAASSLREGVADLVFVDNDGSREWLVLVDFKTDAVLKTPARYADQLAQYASALALSRGLTVERVLFWV